MDMVKRAVVDKYMGILSADTGFFQFVGPRIQCSLYRLAYDEDLEKLQVTVSKLKYNCRTDIIIRLLRQDNVYRWVMLGFELQMSQKGDIIELYMQDIFELRDNFVKAEEYTQDLRTLLSLQSELYFEYCYSNSMFKMFWMDKGREVILENQHIDEWAEKVVNSGYVKNPNELEQVCQNIKSGRDNMQCQLVNSIMSQGAVEEYSVFRGGIILKGSEKLKMLGVITTVDSVTRVKLDNIMVESGRDVLTGLLNKRAMDKVVCSRIGQNPECIKALIVVDVDDFKEVNDRYGHLFGDEILSFVADVLRRMVGNKGYVGRIGGDEFLVLLDSVNGEYDVRCILRAIRSCVENEYKDILKDFKLSCSMGVSIYPRDGDSYEELFKKADRAVYVAKDRGKNRYVIYKEYLHGRLFETVDNGNINILCASKLGKNVDYLSEVDYVIRILYSNGESAIPEVIQKVSENHDLCSLKIYYGEDNEQIYSWGIEKGVSATDEFIHNSDYISEFNKNGMKVVDHIDNLEQRYEKIYNKCRKLGIYRYVQGIIGTKDNVKGMVSFAQNNKKKNAAWSASEYRTFTVITRILSCVLMDRDKS